MEFPYLDMDMLNNGEGFGTYLHCILQQHTWKLVIRNQLCSLMKFLKNLILNVNNLHPLYFYRLDEGIKYIGYHLKANSY